MAEVINLRQARKAKVRAEKAREADANRAKHGLTKAERQRQQSEATRAARELEGKKLED